MGSRTCVAGLEIVEGAARLHVRIEVSHGIISIILTSYVTEKEKRKQPP
jgi:molybdopterin-binding protein